MAALTLGLFATMAAQAYDFEKDGIFYNVTSLEDLTVEVTYENSSSYYTGSYWGDIIIPETVEWNERAFTVTAIGAWAFYSGNITSIHMPSNITSIKDLAFAHCDELDSIIIPDNVTSIGGQAFCECENLKSIIFSKNLKTIDGLAFESCTNLSSVILPQNLTILERDVFTDCTNLSSVTLPENLKTIRSNAFSNCTSLSSITLPSSLNNIEHDAFNGCNTLDSVIVKSSTPIAIEESVFPTETYFNGTLFVPQGCKSVYQNASVWKNFTNIVETDYADPTVRLLTVTVSGGGYVTFLGQTLENGTLDWNVDANSSVYISAYPEPGYQTTITIRDDKENSTSTVGLNFSSVQIGEEPVTIEVTFTKIPVTLTVQQGESGYVEVEAEYGQTRNVRITPYDGWYINSVTFDGMDYTYMLDAENQFTTPELYSNAYLNVDLQPYFTPSPVTLTIQQAESGCVEMEAEYGKTNTIRITPYEGWYINSVTLDGTDYTYMLDAENRFTTPELYDNAFLNVAFEQYNSDGVRGISADGTKVYAQEGRLVIDQTTPGSLIRIYDESGREMKSFTADESRMEITLPANHVYIVKTPQKSVKIKL